MDKYYMILGHPYSRGSVHALIAVIAFLVFGSIGGIYFLMLQKRAQAHSEGFTDHNEIGDLAADSPSAGVSAPQSRKTVEFPNGEEPETLAGILQAHLQASGYAPTESYVLGGESSGGPKDSSITIKARAPNLYTLTLEYNEGNASIDFGYDGTEVWSKASNPSIRAKEPSIAGDIAVVLAAIPHLAWSYGSEKAFEAGLDSVLELKSETIWKGVPCYVIRSRGLLPFEMDHHIDKESFLEVYRTVSFTREDKTPNTIRIEYDNTSRDPESGLPLRYDVYSDGELSDKMVFDSVRLNPTILRVLFTRPRD